jgi:hypothetical protein
VDEIERVTVLDELKCAERGDDLATGQRGAFFDFMLLGAMLLDALGQYLRRNGGRQLAFDLLETNALEARAEVGGWHMAGSGWLMANGF